ncbi:SIR2 family protein [Microbacterium sp.]|uniref:SIR2 family protein n=1 Tax=Microbacterium sp. TaxID=51671 RepID=UPI003F972666
MITLNYDLAVEQAASERGVHAKRGVQTWPESPIAFPTYEGVLRLHKVHGSLDWQLEADCGSAFAAPRLSVHDGISTRPWLVVGDREKLATNGPTLDLLRAAQDALERADHLIVAGYGFADMHVNSMIRDWLNRDDERTLGIIDPTWPYPDERAFRGWLLHTYGDSAPSYAYADPAAQRKSTNRIQAFQGGARAALPRAVALRTVDDSSTWDVTITHVATEEGSSDAKVILQLDGAPLTSVWFTVGRAGPRNVTVIGDDSILAKVGTNFPTTISEWLPGQPAIIRIPFVSDEGREITIYGRSLTRDITRTVTAYPS